MHWSSVQRLARVDDEHAVVAVDLDAGVRELEVERAVVAGELDGAVEAGGQVVGALVGPVTAEREPVDAAALAVAPSPGVAEPLAMLPVM